MGDYVYCLECIPPRKFKQITSTHLKESHGITIKKYLKLHPDANLVSQSIRAKLVAANEAKWSDPDYKDRVSKIISCIITQQWDGGKYSRTQTEDHAMKRSISAQITKDKDPEKYKYVSEETRRRLSASGQGIPYDEWESFATGQEYCPKFNEECRESNRDKYDRCCFLCGLCEYENITSTDLQKRLAVHHVDMNKQQGCDGIRWKLIPLCIHCHRTSHTKIWEARITWLLDNVYI